VLSPTSIAALVLLLAGGLVRAVASAREAALVAAGRPAEAGHPVAWLDGLRGSFVAGELAGAAMLSGLVATGFSTIGWPGVAIALVLVPIAFFVCDLVPRALAPPAASTGRPGGPLALLGRVLRPVEGLVAGAERAAWQRSGLTPLVHPGNAGEAASAERHMINRVFDFANVTVGEIMVPLVNVSAVREDTPIDEVIRVAQREAFSRLPVYQDRLPNITGVLHSFDLLAPGEAVKAADLMRAPYYVPEMAAAAALLRRLQVQGVNLAAVVDEWGGAVGIVAVEDILEEVVGEIEDEYDVKDDPVRRIGPRTYLVNARAEIARLNERFAWRLTAGEYETLGGLLLVRLARIPVVGDTLRVGAVNLRVTQATVRSVDEIAVEELEEKS
jgi:CBS domain containing-hemolysin-like protein